MEQAAEKVTIPYAGSTIIGTFYQASGTPRASLVLNGATGVPQRFYRHFAQWAVQQGLNVLTYDYRDFGESLNRHQKDSPLTMADWMLDDQSAALSALMNLAPHGPIWVLGHSLGGLGVAFHDYDPRVTRITTIGSGFAYHWDHPWSYRPLVLTFWFLLGPLATALMGYLPGKSLGFGSDLPAGVYWQWRRWCTRRDFFASDIGSALPRPDYKRPLPQLRICVAKDDVVVPPSGVQRYADTLRDCGGCFVTFDPADYDHRFLGHIELLGAGNEAVWSDLLVLSETANDDTDVVNA
ncbi:alpha/beta fold hydrolase (plasmid) [Phaeobacter sp. LSS9]|uniref:alpha/beta hydrolase family protein n=1 Tax=unclassified Phaeobacter TaxID=2621772 RepID=UPI000E475BAC|nr:alpha/beta fold hydrolase [Phaeobacter sp. LSS9]AXT37171.1 alpha/beta fold hydrolase [Phaeobacter sp. LSS9]